MTELEIALRLRKRIEFDVETNRERKAALTASKFLGVEICTRANGNGGFTIKFIKA